MLRQQSNAQSLSQKQGLLKKSTTLPIQRGLKNTKPAPVVNQKRIQAPIEQKTIKRASTLVLGDISNNKSQKFTNSASSMTVGGLKRKLKQNEKEQKSIMKENKRMNSDSLQKSQSRVRFSGYSGQKSSSDGKSVRTALSTRQSTSDKANSKKRAPICSVDRYFNSPFSSSHKRLKESNGANSMKISSFQSETIFSAQNYDNCVLSSSANSVKHGAANRRQSVGVTISSFNQQQAMREDINLRRPSNQGRLSMLPGQKPPAHLSLSQPKGIKHQTLSLEDKCTGQKLSFQLYQDKDLPFLNSSSEMGTVIRKTIIDGDVDDDCQTDQEQRSDAKEMLRNELTLAINKYLADKKDGTQANFIKNLNAYKRFARSPFE